MPQRAVKRKKPRVSVVLTEREFSGLEKISGTTERSMSWLGRYAVRRFLKDYEDRQLPLELEIPQD